MADYPLHVLNAQYGKIAYINEVMGLYRIHPGGVWTGMDGLARIQQTIKFFEYLVSGLQPRYQSAAKIHLAKRVLAACRRARGARRPKGRATLYAPEHQDADRNGFARAPPQGSGAGACDDAGVYSRVGRVYGAIRGRSRIAAVLPDVPATTPTTGGPLETGRPLVSILIPAYNAQRYIVEAVESMLRQTFTDFECIVVDDGSTDHTSQLLAELQRRDARVRPLRVPHGGIVDALNSGVDAARGALIARMDADDVASPDRLETQVRYMEEHPDVVALGSKVMLVDPFNSPLWEIDVKLEHQDIEAELLRGNGWALFHPTSVIRREAMMRIGRYRPEYQWSEDIDLFLRLAEVGKLANMPTATLRYRQHFSSVNRTKLELQIRRVERLLADAHRRRALPFPHDFRFEPVAQLGAYEQVMAWGRRALINRNFRVRPPARGCGDPVRADQLRLVEPDVSRPYWRLTKEPGENLAWLVRPFVHHPDVSIEDRVVVTLELDRAGLGAFFGAGAGLGGDLVVILNNHAVLNDRDYGILRLLPGGVEFGGVEFDVIRLPSKRWVAHVHNRSVLCVYRAAPVGFREVAEGIQT